MTARAWLTRRQLFIAAAYSAIFPLTNLVGGGLAMFGIALTLPFLGLAWVGGTALASLFRNEGAYLAGAALTVFLQVLLVLLIREAVIRKRNPGAAT